FHIGRVGGFILLGGTLGLLGSKLNYSVSFTGYLTIVIAVVMFYIGLQILGIVPNITKLGFHLPKKLSGAIHKIQKVDHHLAPILIGALTFFLPCGFTQSMQLAAVASGDFFTGAVVMGAFALGTLPALLAVGIGSSYAKKREFKLLNRLVGVVVVFFAFSSLNSGLVLAGSTFTLDFWKGSGGAAVATVSDNLQIVKMDVDWNFKPTEFRIKKGIPVRWEINGINLSGCSNEVVIPKFNLSQKLQKGLNVVEFTPIEEGILPFSCWMGMLNGRFIVTDAAGGFSDISVQELEAKLAQPIPQGSCDGSCGNSDCPALRGERGSCDGGCDR
ncbi:MAG: sulfite exporter TauE/SafE family protein, partial [Patescibacteria group bacterium]